MRELVARVENREAFDARGVAGRPARTNVALPEHSG
jgi:hypothetical protein